MKKREDKIHFFKLNTFNSKDCRQNSKFDDKSEKF